ncbi:MAG: His/Gly/Thr/Pro-type tRNA ligase C-terminal domain-containing protein [Acidimicrobiia bacterium]
MCIVGDDELAAGTVTVRDLRGDQAQTTLDRAGVVGTISERLARQDDQ